MTYSELEKVNSEIKYLPMGDDDYAPVAERILAFRKMYPEGFICTELTADAHGNNVFHTSVGMYSSGDKVVLGTGTAREKEFDAIDNISPLERAETASVGRALGMVGFGVKGSVCSFEELDYAISTAGDVTADTPKKTFVKADIVTPEPIILKPQKPESPFGDTSSGDAPTVPEVSVVAVDVAKSSDITSDTTALKMVSNATAPSERLATEKQKGIITKYYGNKLQDLLDSVGATSIDTLSYANAAEIVAQMVSG